MMAKIRSQDGYYLVMVAVLMSLFLIIIMSMLDTSEMERLISRNSRDAEQAFQLAEGALYLGIEQTHKLLSRDCHTAEKLPSTIQLEVIDYTDHINGKTVQMKLQKPRLLNQHSDFCIYEFNVQGQCAPAQHKLKAQVRYEYLQFYNVLYGEDGSVRGMTFSHREFTDRGKVVSMERQ